jgi:HlyD family secretion protein/adhesin transport system membrane fusion protein
MISSKEKQTRYLSQAVRLEEAVNPHIIRATMLMVSLAILIFIGWAGFTNINEVARTPGEVVPHGYQQVVQHLEGGIIKEIAVSEGQVVEKNQILLFLDGVGTQSDLNRAQSKQQALEMQEERLRAYIENREPNFSDLKNQDLADDQEEFFSSMRNARDKERQIIKNQISQKQQSIQTLNAQLQTAEKNYAIAKNLYDRYTKLNQQGYMSTVKFLESEQRLNETNGQIKGLKSQIASSRTEINEYQARLASLSARYLDEVNENLDQTLEDKAQNREILQKLQERMARLEVRAPVRGLVKGLTVNTVGSVVQPGQTLMEIVPLDEQLEVMVRIPPQHIGHLKAGQDVQVKFSTYDFSRYGSILGRLEKISATTFSGENGERYYQGTVILSHNYVGHDQGNLIMPGMTVMADIVTGRKTILEYLLKPVSRALKTAFTER